MFLSNFLHATLSYIYTPLPLEMLVQKSLYLQIINKWVPKVLYSTNVTESRLLVLKKTGNHFVLTHYIE